MNGMIGGLVLHLLQHLGRPGRRQSDGRGHRRGGVLEAPLPLHHSAEDAEAALSLQVGVVRACAAGVLPRGLDLGLGGAAEDSQLSLVRWGEASEVGRNSRVSSCNLQGISKRPFPGLVNFILAVSYHFCLNLPAGFSQPGSGLYFQVPLPSPQSIKSLISSHTYDDFPRRLLLMESPSLLPTNKCSLFDLRGLCQRWLR